MHNYIRLELNKIDSNLYDDFLPEEIDAFINQAQAVFIKERYSPKSNSKKEGFEMSQKRIDDLRRCVVSNLTLNLYKSNDPTIVYATLPSNYQFLTSGKTTLYLDCCGGAINYSTTTVTSTIGLIPFNPSSDVDTGITDFSHFTLTSNSNPILDTTNFSNYIYPGQRDDFAELVVASLLPQYTSSYSLYYEVYQGNYYPNKLIVVQNSTSAPAPVYNFYNPPSNQTVSWFTISNDVYTPVSGGTNQTSFNQYTQEDLIDMDNPFKKTSTDQTIINITGQQINIYLSENIIAQNTNISYLRRPKRVSLLLQQDCELADHTHLEIVSMAVSHILEIMESPRVQTNEKELARSE